MDNKEIRELAELIERADLIIMVYGEKKAGLGKDMQEAIVTALRKHGGNDNDGN